MNNTPYNGVAPLLMGPSFTSHHANSPPTQNIMGQNYMTSRSVGSYLDPAALFMPNNGGTQNDWAVKGMDLMTNMNTNTPLPPPNNTNTNQVNSLMPTFQPNAFRQQGHLVPAHPPPPIRPMTMPPPNLNTTMQKPIGTMPTFTQIPPMHVPPPPLPGQYISPPNGAPPPHPPLDFCMAPLGVVGGHHPLNSTPHPHANYNNNVNRNPPPPMGMNLAGFSRGNQRRPSHGSTNQIGLMTTNSSHSSRNPPIKAGSQQFGLF